MVIVSYQLSLKESGPGSDGGVRRIHQEYGKRMAPRGTSFWAAGTVGPPGDDRAAEAICARLNVIKEVEGRNSQLT